MPRSTNEDAKIKKLENQIKDLKNQLREAQQQTKAVEMQYKKKCQDEFARGVGIMEKWIANRDKAMAKAIAAVDKVMHRQAKTEAKMNKNHAPASQAAAKKSSQKYADHGAKKVAPKAPAVSTSAKRKHRPARQEPLMADIEEQPDMHSEIIDIA